MKVFCGLSKITHPTPCALAIGNFDGVHRGHKELFIKLCAAASRLGIPAAVLTFDPHPRQFFALNQGKPSEAPTIIAPLRNKIQALSDAGIEQVTIARFDQALANLSNQEFIEQVLVKKLGVKWLIVGEHFRFGKNRTGTTDDLLEASKKFGFEVEILPSITSNEKRISSSAVRAAIEHSDFKKVAELLGQPYCISGHVIHGDKRGRILGFPTMNLPMRHYNPVLSGVFITQVHGLAKEPFPSVSMIGTRPTIDDSNRILLETHILDYAENCYGSLIHIEFLQKLRNNQKFPDLSALKAAINQDVASARAFFTKKTSSPITHKDRI